MNPTFLLDTNICIYIRQRRPAQILQRFRRLKVGEAAISVITYGELIYRADNACRVSKSRTGPNPKDLNSSAEVICAVILILAEQPKSVI